MKALKVMALVMMTAMVSVSFVACGGSKAEAPAEEAAAPVVEEVAEAACDSCCADSCCADSACCGKCCADSAAVAE